MSTVADLIARTRLHLYSSHMTETNRLNGTITDSVTTISLDEVVTYFTAGSQIAIGDELMFVWSVDETNRQVTVTRGFAGTTAAAHTDGDLVESNPLYPQVKIRQELITEIRSWGQRLWNVDAVNLSVASGDRVLDMTGVPEGVLFILEALYKPTSPQSSWKRCPGRFERNMDVTEFASGMCWITDQTAPESTMLRLIFAQPFELGTFTDATNLQTTVLMPEAYEDIAAIGAAYRLVLPREVHRASLETQPEPRDAQEVPPTHLIQTADALKKMRNERMADEIRVLATKYPWRIS